MNKQIRLNEIPLITKPTQSFGPFTSAVSATAMVALIVVSAVWLLG